MTILKVTFMAFVLAGLAACGGKTTGPSNVTLPRGERSEVVATNQTLNEILAKSNLGCETSGTCPEALGLLVGIDSGKAYRCTAFVLENGLIYTNSHCVPENLQGKSNVACEQEIGFVFNIDGKTERIKCERILTSSDLSEGPGIQDVALMRAKLPKGLKPFKSTLRSRYSGERVSIWRVNPVGIWDGTVVSSTCSLKSNTFFGEFFDGPKSPAINTLGCETVAGNSGSPIVDKEGKVLGIHQSSLKDKSGLGESLLGHFKNGSFASLGTGTNLSCLCEKHGIGQSCEELPQSCTGIKFSGSDRRRSKIVEQEIYQRNGGQAATLMSKEARNLPSYIRWEVAYGHRLNQDARDLSLSLNLMVAPNCLDSPRDFKRELRKEGSELRETTHVLELTAPYCKVDFLFNELFDFESVGINEGSCLNANMTLFLRYKNGQWEGEAQFIDEAIAAVDRPYAYNFKLPTCK